jgi:Flp pilus assembly pilin Flp
MSDYISLVIGRAMLAAGELHELRKRQEGQTLVEYALIIAVLSVGLILALGTLRNKIASTFTDITNAL